MKARGQDSQETREKGGTDSNINYVQDKQGHSYNYFLLKLFFPIISFLRSFIHSFIDSFIDSFIHSLTH